MHSYDYATIRLVPQVEREEFINVGVILFCKEKAFCRAAIELDEERTRLLFPAVELPAVRSYLDAIPRICEGGEAAGPLGALPVRERFLMLVAPRSTMVQPSPVHTGLTDDPAATLERLMDQMVRQFPQALSRENTRAQKKEQ